MSHQTNTALYFDMELFLHNARETRIQGQELELLLTRWADWLPSLHIQKLPEPGVLAVWLDESVEKAVDDAWKESPSRSFMLNALAQTMCMCAVHEAIPEIEDAGCAPSPLFSVSLGNALNRAGLPCAPDSLTVARRYAVITPYPFKGGCEICALQGNCPQQKSDKNFSVTLPGHEQ